MRACSAMFAASMVNPPISLGFLHLRQGLLVSCYGPRDRRCRPSWTRGFESCRTRGVAGMSASNEADDAPPLPKRGRGRPKGSGKKSARDNGDSGRLAGKTVPGNGNGRGRRPKADASPVAPSETLGSRLVSDQQMGRGEAAATRVNMVTPGGQETSTTVNGALYDMKLQATIDRGRPPEEFPRGQESENEDEEGRLPSVVELYARLDHLLNKERANRSGRDAHDLEHSFTRQSEVRIRRKDFCAANWATSPRLSS